MPSGERNDVRKGTKERVKTNAKLKTESERSFLNDDKK